MTSGKTVIFSTKGYSAGGVEPATHHQTTSSRLDRFQQSVPLAAAPKTKSTLECQRRSGLDRQNHHRNEAVKFVGLKTFHTAEAARAYAGTQSGASVVQLLPSP